ncbi:DUF523 domain-containing protein [Paenibacillus thiaminolyticus]|uniref:DUF523 domain-containing protein n=1 Tax=Paenibacillus thiaminolyticus TaxID=49283 RepID=UPI0023300377|nr:DUF523 domain-containing protein [Paenibacillus thiaminolyticus]WCF07696.1 DUF523 domain-containing protein [Paenibacillus thiaminolyticus]
MIIVSACLAGLDVRYDGTHRLDHHIAKLVDEGKAITACPELLGGFATPREPAEIIGGDGEDVLDGKAQVIERSGRDVTAMYVEGARETLRQAQAMKATLVVLKEYSPSCGSSMIYNGEFAGKAKAGLGVTAALLRRHGIEVISEEQFADWVLE